MIVKHELIRNICRAPTLVTIYHMCEEVPGSLECVVCRRIINSVYEPPSSRAASLAL